MKLINRMMLNLQNIKVVEGIKCTQNKETDKQTNT